MRKSILLGGVSVLGLAGIARADVPAVVTDIAPVHSLVSMVMGDLGSPSLIVQPGASPHGYSMRPSEARALDQAQAVFWVGDDLAPWLETSMEALAGDANVVTLMQVKGTRVLEFRDGATFDAHDHGAEGHEGHGHVVAHEGHDHGDDEHEEHAGHEGHDHDLDAGHDHEEHATDHDHDGHDHDGHDHAGHDHDGHAEHDAHAEHEGHHDHGHDPHAWLDPDNARVWLDAIAAELSALDPENAATYAANADAAKTKLTATVAEISAQLAPVRGESFVVFHDAYQYYETYFDIPAAGSITLSDASDPSPARIAEVRDKARALDVTCAFSEPQYDPNLIRTVFQGSDAKTGVMDPIGTDLTPGPDLYPQLLRNLTDSLVTCLTD